MAFSFWRWRDKRLSWLLIGGALLWLLHIFGWLSFLERPLAAVLSRPGAAVTGLSSALNRSADQSEIDNYPELLNDCRSEQQRLVNENANLQYLREENRVLRKFVNLIDEAKRQYLTARVVSRLTPSSDSRENDRLIIDRGLSDGLSVGLLVVNEDGLAVGRLLKVGPTTAEVVLLTGNLCKLSVALNSSQKTIGIAEGGAGLTVGVSFIPQTEELNVGEIMVTSGLESNIAAGIPIGRIVKVDRLDNEIWQSAILEPIAELDNLRVVGVLLPAAANR